MPIRVPLWPESHAAPHSAVFPISFCTYPHLVCALHLPLRELLSAITLLFLVMSALPHNTSTTPISWHCDHCHITSNSDASHQRHVASKKHLKRVSGTATTGTPQQQQRNAHNTTNAPAAHATVHVNVPATTLPIPSPPLSDSPLTSSLHISSEPSASLQPTSDVSPQPVSAVTSSACPSAVHSSPQQICPITKNMTANVCKTSEKMHGLSEQAEVVGNTVNHSSSSNSDINSINDNNSTNMSSSSSSNNNNSSGSSNSTISNAKTSSTDAKQNSNQTAECRVCDQSFYSIRDYYSHLAGKSHSKAEIVYVRGMLAAVEYMSECISHAPTPPDEPETLRQKEESLPPLTSSDDLDDFFDLASNPAIAALQHSLANHQRGLAWRSFIHAVKGGLCEFNHWKRNMTNTLAELHSDYDDDYYEDHHLDMDSQYIEEEGEDDYYEY